MTQAVASIVAAGTYTSHGYQRFVAATWTSRGMAPAIGGGPVTTTHQTELARVLDLPPPPRPKAMMGCLAAVLIFVGIVFGGFSLWAVTVDDGDAETQEEPGEGVATALATVMAPIIFASPPLVGGALIAIYSRRARTRWQRDFAHWQRAVPIAARLVYCARDHVVYDPQVPDAVLPVTQAAWYAYQQAARER